MTGQVFTGPDGRRFTARDVSNMDAVPETDMDRAQGNVEKARRGVTALRTAAAKWPELSRFADTAEPLIDQADDYELREEEARAAVILRTRERDAASRSALSRGNDPQEAEKAASDALKAAQDDAERNQRYYIQTASLAASEAARGTRRLAELRKDAAPEMLHEHLRALATARREALEAVTVAERKLREVTSRVYGVRAVAAEAGERGGGLARLAADPHHDFAARRLGSGGATYEDALAELRGFRDRLDFRSSMSPIDLGRDMGAAVRYAVENGSAEEAAGAIARDRAEWEERERERGTNARPFKPAPFEE